MKELESFVLGRTSEGARVAVLGQAPTLVEALRSAGREVLEAAAGATHVVLAPGEPLASWEDVLRGLREVAPDAEVLFGFRNAGASTALLAAWVGSPSGAREVSESQVAQGLPRVGYQVVKREALSGPTRMTSLPERTELGLRALIEQLNPSAAADVVLYAVRPGGASVAEPVPGLLSVVLWAGRPGTERLLDEALFSLACQEYRPLELLLVEPGEGGASALESLQRYQQLGGFEVRHVHGTGAGLMREAIRQARGQYLSFLDAAWVVYPRHFVQLVRALRSGDTAWAVARARRTALVRTDSGTPYAREKIPFPLGERLELSHLLQEPELLYSLVIDRTRLGPFSLTVEDPSESWLDDLPVRLGALFEPVFTAGLATCEVRALDGARVAAAEVPALQVLRSLASVEERVSLARAEGAQTKDFRHRFIDSLNTRLRDGAPWLHSALKHAASRLRQRT